MPFEIPNINLVHLLTIAALNPALIAVAYVMGRRCDQAGKLLLAAFAASAAGMALYYIGALAGIAPLAHLIRAAAGLFIASFLFALVYAGLAYTFAKPKRS